MKEYSEQEIIEGCIREDSRYQRLFFEKYYSRMYAVCFRYSKDEEEAKDILQEGFMKAFDGIRLFKGESSLATWLTRIMTNTAINYLKKRNKNLFASLDEQFTEVAEVEEQELSKLNELHAEEALALLQKLPAGYRSILNLYVFEGYSHKQISALLGISEGTSKSQLSKARALLKKFILLCLITAKIPF